MIDWTRIAGFDWDEGNARKSSERHGVAQAEAEQMFFNAPLRVVADVRHSAQEPWFHALGKTDQGRRLHVTFTLRGGILVRVVSARDMSRKEREIYDKGEDAQSPEKDVRKAQHSEGDPHV